MRYNAIQANTQSNTVDHGLCILVDCSPNAIQPYKQCKVIQWVAESVHWWAVALRLHSPTNYIILQDLATRMMQKPLDTAGLDPETISMMTEVVSQCC